MNIVEYEEKHDEQIKDLLVELQEYLVRIDDWNTQAIHEHYREESFRIDMRKVNEQEGKIYLAVQDEKVIGLVMGCVDIKDEIDKISNDCVKTGSIIELVTSEQYRGSGIGKTLLMKMEAYFRYIGCKRINIEVFGPNKLAYKFYNNNGYTDRDIIVSKRID